MPSGDYAQPPSVSRLRYEFSRRGLKPLKSLGQNFLTDANILAFIADLLEPSPADFILEVGSGPANLTRLLAPAGYVLGVEIDRGLAALAAEAVSDFGNIEIVHADILAGKNEWNPKIAARVAEAAGRFERVKIASNTPYSIATPLLSALALGDFKWDAAVMMLQREIVERLTAEPSTKEYGVLSVIGRLAFAVEVAKYGINPKVFWPSPGVESAVVVIEPSDLMSSGALPGKDFHRFLKTIFSLRRKTASGAIKALKLDDAARGAIARLCEKNSFTLKSRFEEMPPPVILDIYRSLIPQGHSRL